jgi:hypothetical protein
VQILSASLLFADVAPVEPCDKHPDWLAARFTSSNLGVPVVIISNGLGRPPRLSATAAILPRLSSRGVLSSSWLAWHEGGDALPSVSSSELLMQPCACSAKAARRLRVCALDLLVYAALDETGPALHHYGNDPARR